MINKALLAAVDPPGGAAIPEGIYNPAINGRIGQGNGVVTINTFLNNFITIAFIAGGIITLFFLISGGIGWITSGGDKEKLAGAQKKITHAVIGLLLLFSVFAILKLVGAILGINLLTIDLSPVFI